MTKAKEEPKIPEELKQRFEQLKIKLEKFKKNVLSKFNEYVVGISLMPPADLEKEKKLVKENENRELSKEEESRLKNTINVLVLVDDADTKKMSQEELSSKLGSIVEKFATEIDKDFKVQTMLLSELRELCFDGKYEAIQQIAMSAPIHDPKDLIAALRISEVHKNMTLKKFEKYIVSYVAAGSLFRGEKSNDIDVYVVVDDTDVKRMPRLELKDKLGGIIRSMGFEASMITGVKKQFHIQVYILTDFWDSLKDAHPVIFTLLRDGVPLYDRGVFTPWKLLLKMGRIRPSPEAIDMQMSIGARLLERVNQKMLGIVGEDLFYALLNPAQAALMLYGVSPPTPKETVTLMGEIFVKKEKMLEQKYVNILEKIRNYYKDIEHGKTKEIKGADIDKLVNEAKDYLTRIEKLFGQIEKKRGTEDIIEVHDACMNLVREILNSENIEAKGDVVKAFKKFAESKGIPANYAKVVGEIMQAKKDYLDKKLSRQEAEKVKRDVRVFIKTMGEYLQRLKGDDLDRSRVRIRYGEKYAEIFLLDNVAFIVHDIDAKEKEVSKANINADGGLSEVKKSSLEDMQRHLQDNKIPERIFIKEKLIDDLKKIFGKNVEIMVG